jgi:GNAT superfamily N-acetyltransferase
MRIEPFDASSDLATLTAIHDVIVAVGREQYPDDEPVPLEEYLANIRHNPDYMVDRMWGAFDADGRAAGRAVLFYADIPENRHVADVRVDVSPDHRRQGVGSRLLATAAAEAQRAGRRLLQMGAREGGVGEHFLAARGGVKRYVEHHNRLRIDEVDREGLEGWVRDAKVDADGYSLLRWDDGVPHEHLAAFARLLDVMNDAPRGDLDMEDEQNQPEQVEAWNAVMAARGQELWTVVARHDATGDLAGWTSILFPSVRKDVAFQLGTGVATEHRGHGLGRWMKAVNLLRLLDEQSAVRRVETENATTNQWMLSINTDMGFRSFETIGWWELAVSDVLV